MIRGGRRESRDGREVFGNCKRVVEKRRTVNRLPYRLTNYVRMVRLGTVGKAVRWLSGRT